VLSDVEALPRDSAGALVFGLPGQTVGTILVENGRICWAASLGLDRRLTDRLREGAGPRAGAAEMEAIYRECQKTGVPLGETLVKRGIVSEEDLRAALLAHSAEAIEMLGRLCGGAWRWVSRRGQHDARFSFSPAEVLERVCADLHPDLAFLARAELEEVLEGGGWGVCFARGAGSAIPLPVASSPAVPLGVEAFQRMGRWAAEALDVCRIFDPAANLVTLLEGESALLAWPEDGAVYVVCTPEPSALTYVVAKRRRAAGA
jgi:hypothetical protein